MSATAARRRARRPGAAANRHRHSNQPSSEELQQQVERQQREINDLRDQLARREKQLADAEKQIVDAEKQIVDAEKQIADLERQLAGRKKNSTNSSKPPSSDGLAGEQRPRGGNHKSRRKPGAQPGHAGHHRRLVPAADVSAVEVLLPKLCGQKGSAPRRLSRAGITTVRNFGLVNFQRPKVE